MPGGSVAALVVPSGGCTLALLRGSLVPSSEDCSRVHKHLRCTTKFIRVEHSPRRKAKEPRVSVKDVNTTITRETKSPIRKISNRGSGEKDKSEAFKECKERSPKKLKDCDRENPTRHGSNKTFEESNAECKERSPIRLKNYPQSNRKRFEGYSGKIPVRTWKSEYQRRDSSPHSRDRSKTRSRDRTREIKTYLHSEETGKDFEVTNWSRRCLGSELARDIDTCDPFECAALKDRLEKHKSEQHSESYQRKESPLQWKRFHDSETHQPPIQFESQNRRHKCNSSNSRGNNTTQTKLTFADLGNLTIKLEPNDDNDEYKGNLNHYTQLDIDENTSYNDERGDEKDHYEAWADDENENKSGCKWPKCSKNRHQTKYSSRSCKQRNKVDYYAPYLDTNNSSTTIKSRKKGSDEKLTVSRMNSDRDFRNKINSNFEYFSREVNTNSDQNNPYPNKNDSEHTIPLVNTKTHDCLMPKCVSYEENVKEEIKEWIQKIPINNCDSCSLLDKENIANHLINKILKLSKDTDICSYEVEVTREVNRCLDNLKIMYTGDKRDEQMFKQFLFIGLLERLIKIRNKWICPRKCNDGINENQSRISSSTNRNKSKSEHSIRRTVSSDYICKSATKIKAPCKKNCNSCNNNVEEEISAWLDELNLTKNDKTQLITRKYIVEILKNRLSPYLKKPYNTTNKLILKAKIVEILDDLPININSTNKRVLLIRYAEALAKKLLSLQVRLEKDSDRRTKYCTFLNDALTRLDLRDYVLRNLRYCLEINDVDIQNCTEDDIVYTLVRNFESLCFNHDSRVKTDIIRILEAKEELSEENILYIADCILENVKDINQEFTDKFLNHNPMKSFAEPCITVYTSEHDISGPSFITLLSSTFKKESDASLKRDLSKLNQEEMEYVEKYLRDEIWNWLNEQPSEIYSNIGKATHKKIVEELALNLQSRLINNRPSKEISKEVAQWLRQVVKASEEQNVDNMSKNLAKRLTKLTHDAKREIQRKYKEEKKAEKWNNTTNTSISFDISDIIDPDDTIKELILKYMDYNFDVDDSTTRGAFTELLKTELQRLSTPTRKEVYDNFTVNPEHISSLEKVHNELQYILNISDWLKNIPIESSFNTVNNKQRIEFVNSLAKTVAEIEEERLRAPAAMDYDMYESDVIYNFIRQLPLLPNQDGYILLMIDQLLLKISAIITNGTNSTLNSTRICDENLTDFIEGYILMNGREIADDELKLDAWSKRLVELIKIISDCNDPTALTETKVYERLASIPNTQEPLKRFSLELGYAKEVSEWLKNLPFLDSTANIEVKIISDLSEKICERTDKKAVNANDTQADTDLINYISNWISRLPLDNNKELFVNVAIQQLLNRIDIINKGTNLRLNDRPRMESQSQLIVNQQKRSSIKYTCCRRRSCIGTPCQVKIDSKGLIVDIIEKWCNELPIEGSEHLVKPVKNKIAMKLLRKLEKLTDNPIVYNNDYAFINLFAEEVNSQLRNVPRSFKIKGDEKNLKTALLENVMQSKNEIKAENAGELYEQKLESTIETSMPNPIQTPQGDDPCFQIYKHRLAERFILDNFDHEDEAVKQKYERRIQSEVDKYFRNAQLRNDVTMTKEALYNELYSALFKVPIPNEISIKDEIEEIKTRCEIDLWFDELPVREATGVGELLEWDQILKILAKQIHELEKTNKSDDKFHEEIVKWLTKLPLRPGEERNIDVFANRLKERLKTSAKIRKCITAKENPITRNGDKNARNSSDKIKSKSKQTLTEPRDKINGRRKWGNATFIPQEYQPGVPKKKASDIILEAVEAWCNQLPLYAQNRQDEEQLKDIRDDLITKVVRKINELNKDAETINDDALYDNLLDNALETLISALPQNTNLEQSKNARKYQLVEAIRSIKPLVKDERSRHDYRLKLNDVVIKILPRAKNNHSKEEAHIKDIKDNVVDHFIEYIYNSGNNEDQQFHKRKIQELISKYLSKAKISKDPMMTGNQLICEMLKIPEPSEPALRDEIQEIRMKNEVHKFFDELEISENDQSNKLKTSLAIKLNEIENTGYTSENNLKIKEEIAKSIKKLGVDVSPERIGEFFSRLKQNESIRKAPSSRIPGSNNGSTRKAYNPEGIVQMNNFSVPIDSPGLSEHSPVSAVSLVSQSPENLNWNTILSSDGLMQSAAPQSALPKVNISGQSYQQGIAHPISQAGKSPVFTFNSTDGLLASSPEQVFSPPTPGRGTETNIGQSVVDYPGFNQGVPLSSTVQRGNVAMPTQAQQTFHTYIGADKIYDPVEESIINTPVRGQYFQPSGGTVQPWNTLSSLGSVQQPEKQAIVMIHQPPASSRYIAEEALRTPEPISETIKEINPYYSELPGGNAFEYEDLDMPLNKSAFRYPMILQPADINTQPSTHIRETIPRIVINSRTLNEMEQSGPNLRSHPPSGLKTSLPSGTGKSGSTAQVVSPKDVEARRPAALRLDPNEESCLTNENIGCECECDCEICVRSRRKPLRPYCVIPMLQYCESVDDFLPIGVRYPCRFIY